MNDLDMFESLLNCQSVEELHATTARIIRQMGFEHFIYGVQVNVSLTRPYRFILSGYPKDWRSHYIEAGLENIDPTVQHCIKNKRVIPLVWGSHAFNARPAARLLNEASEFGLASGASFAIHGAKGEAAMLSLASATKPRQAKKDIVATLGEAQLLACYLHEAVQNLVLSKEALPLKQVALTDRERECLLWAAEGKTTWEIANILHVSERTIVFHVQNASRKMGVSNRQHAVAKALSMGLISP